MAVGEGGARLAMRRQTKPSTAATAVTSTATTVTTTAATTAFTLAALARDELEPD